MFEPWNKSFHDYALSIRQKNSEELIRQDYYKTAGKDVWYGWQLQAFAIDEGKEDGYNVSATISHSETGEVQIRSKYIVGADGGSSTVRRLANIQMEGSNTVYQWIRIDGKMKTSMPDADIGFAAVESAHHGNVLWVKLDQDAHRIGFALNSRILEKYPNGSLTEADAVREAQEAMTPFRLEIERLDWWTQYKIRQNVATTLLLDKYILLAGDAAHVHSSGFAQGMNTGIHDATNLIWKLSGILKGWYKPAVLESYNTERHAAAKQLIAIDMNAAALISGDIPAKYQSSGLTAQEVLANIMKESMDFSSGLGVKYMKSELNRAPQATMLQAGSRAPDVLIRGPGPHLPFRLQERVLHALPISWNVLVFAGDYRSTQKQLIAARETFKVLQEKTRPVRFATILSGPGVDIWAAFDGPPLGKVYFDPDGSAHAKYGISLESGAAVIIRPDSITAFATMLDEVADVAAYFDEIFQ
jgi:phenol 2-monooxygenase